MKNNKNLTNPDISIIDEAIQIVWNKKFNYIFKNKELINNTLVVSYDDLYIYLWSKNDNVNLEKLYRNESNFNVYRLSHSFTLTDKDKLGWSASIASDLISRLLPQEFKKNNFQIPKASGGLYHDFVNTQLKLKGKKDNPYITRESYLATIVHEFGHIYYNQHKNWWYSNIEENIDMLSAALNSYSTQKIFSQTKSFHIPSPLFFSELYAFLSEISISENLFPTHFKNLKIFAKKRIKELIRLEKLKNLEEENSVIGENSPHNTALILGSLIRDTHRTEWVSRILTKITF